MNKSGQQVIYIIIQVASKVQTAKVRLYLQWIPGHCEDIRNNAADQLTKKAI